jgi:hypothetical protein
VSNVEQKVILSTGQVAFFRYTLVAFAS